MAGRNASQRFDKVPPKRGVFVARPRLVPAFAVFRRSWEQTCWRQRFEGVPPLQGAFRRLGVVKANLLEKRKLAGGVVVQAGALILGCVVALELFSFEPGSHPISGGHDPLQEGVRLVMGSSRIDQGVRRVFLGGHGSSLTTDERPRLLSPHFGEVWLNQIESQCCVRRVSMAKPAALFVERGVKLQVRVDPGIAIEYARAFRKLAEIM